MAALETTLHLNTMPRRPRYSSVRDRWSPRPEIPTGKSQPKPLPRPAREEREPKLHYTLLEPSLEAGRTQAVASDVEVPKASNAHQRLQGAKDNSAESMAL